MSSVKSLSSTVPLRLTLLLGFLLALALPGATWAADQLPIPRFVSLRSNEVNIRTGPGPRYPIEWVMTKQTLPVEILEEFEGWRRIRDWEGTQGWVHQSMLSGRRTGLVIGSVRLLRRKAEDNAATVARLEPGVIGHLMECRGGWCRMEIGGLRGWLRVDEIFGVYPKEAFD